LATKIRNRLLSTTATMLMGSQRVSIDVLQRVLSSSSKLRHGLVSSDLNPRDHQNYSSCWRISRDEIFQILETMADSTATIIYIRILRSVIDAYIEKSTGLLDRIFQAWISMFLSRLWIVWIHKMGKPRLDRLLIHLKDPADEFRNLSRANMLVTILFDYTSRLFNRTQCTLTSVSISSCDRREAAKGSTRC
jgi:hypothetical protein